MAIVSVNSSLSADIKGVDGVPNTAIKSINAATFPTPIAPFIMEIDSTNLTSQTMTLGLTSTGTYDFDVDWGDGSPVTTITFWNSPDATHVYSASQKYTITLQPNTATGLRGYNFNRSVNQEPRSYTSVISWGSVYLNLATDRFQGCVNLNWNTATAGIPNFSSKNIGSSSFMRDCDSLTADLSGWGTSGSPITGDFIGLFFLGGGSPNLNWVGSGMTDLRLAFSSSNYNASLSNWDTSAVTDMSDLFNNNAVFNQDISMWNTSSVTTMAFMFRRTFAFNQPLNSWDVSSVTNMQYMFYQSAYNQPLNNWNTASVTAMNNMFNQAFAFNQDIDSWNTSSVTNMNSMFMGLGVFNQNLNSWDVSNVTNFIRVFRQASNFNGNISSWNPISATSFSEMFLQANNFNSNISAWNVASSTSFNRMFNYATVFNQDLRNWNVANGQSFREMFVGSSCSFPLNLWRLYSATDMTSFASNASFTDAQCEDAFVAWSNDPLTATNVNATNIWGSRTYPIGGPMQTAVNKLTSATYNWTITGLTFV